MPRVQQKRGTNANLTSVDPTPLAGELIAVTDENTLVIGNGTDAYTSLAYVTATPRSHTQAWSTITDTPTTLSGYGITDAVSSSDARLSDSRTPTDGSVTTAKIADANVTYAKLQNVAATDRLLGRSSAGAGVVEEITCTSFGRSLIDDADAAAGRTTLGAAPAASPTFSGTVTHSGLVRWEYPDKSLDAAVTDLGYIRVYDETGFAAGIGVSTASFNIGTQGAINLRFVTNGTQRAIINTAGNVGIGTNTPSSLLHVNGVITVSAGTAAAPALVASGDANTGLLFPAADTVAISTAGVERVRVRADGGVAIGYAGAATHRFGISGSVSGTGVNVAFQMAPTIESAVTSMYGIFSQPAVASGTTLANFFHFWVGQGTYSGTVTNQYGLRVDSGFTGATNNYGVSLAIAAGSGRWNIHASGSAPNFFAGNVGCGIENPTTALEVNGDVTISDKIVHAGDSNTAIRFPANDAVAVETGGSERVRVKSTGAVRFVPLATDPASGEAGDVYYNSVDNKLRVYNGTSWVDLH